MFLIEGKKLHIEKALTLAPMAGVGDYAFRILCKKYGAEFLTSEMVSAKGMYYRDSNTGELAALRASEAPAAVQLFGSDPDIMAWAADALTRCDYKGCRTQMPPSAIDINMGCPVKKVVSGGDGSALMKNPELIFDIVRAVNRATPLPVTVKIRAGWDAEHINAIECAKAAEEAGASAITVHGRTREQMYSPPVDLGIIRAVKDAVKIPVIGNGGINSSADAFEMLSSTSCDGIAVARGAEGNPFIFAQIRAAINGEPIPEFDLHERIRCALDHIDLVCDDIGEERAIPRVRKHAAWYLHGLRGSAQVRARIMNANTKDEMTSLLRGFEETFEE